VPVEGDGGRVRYRASENARHDKIDIVAELLSRAQAAVRDAMFDFRVRERAS